MHSALYAYAIARLSVCPSRGLITQKRLKSRPAIVNRLPCFNCAWQLTSPPFLSLSHSFSLSPLPSVSCQYIDQSKICTIHVLTFFFILVNLLSILLALFTFMTTSLQIVSDINFAPPPALPGKGPLPKLQNFRSAIWLWVILQQSNRQWNLTRGL